MFDENGFVHGFAICTPDEMVPIRRQIEAALEEGPTKFRHLDCRLVYELCAHQEVVGRVASILGPDLLLGHSSFFNKPPRSEGFGKWHPDKPAWQIEPDICLSAWNPIDRADTANGCLAMIPGSHRRRIPHVDMEGAGFWGGKADPTFVDETNKVSIELEPGEFEILDGWVLHHSPPNTSARDGSVWSRASFRRRSKLTCVKYRGGFPRSSSSAPRWSVAPTTSTTIISCPRHHANLRRINRQTLR